MSAPILCAKAMATLDAICNAWGGEVFTDDLLSSPAVIVRGRGGADDDREFLAVAVCAAGVSGPEIADVAEHLAEDWAPSRTIIVVRGAGDGLKATAPQTPYQVWTEEEMCCNVSRHALQFSDMHVLAANEVADLLGLLSLKREDLPRLALTDPFVKFHGLAADSVVRVSKMRETGMDVKYLLVAHR